MGSPSFIHSLFYFRFFIVTTAPIPANIIIPPSIPTGMVSPVFGAFCVVLVAVVLAAVVDASVVGVSGVFFTVNFVSA